MREITLDTPLAAYLECGERTNTRIVNALRRVGVKNMRQLRGFCRCDPAMLCTVRNLGTASAKVLCDQCRQLPACPCPTVVRSAPRTQGMVIAFEGITGSGKTTQIDLLKEYLWETQGCLVNVVDQPITSCVDNLLYAVDTGQRKLSPEARAQLHVASLSERVHNSTCGLITQCDGKALALCDSLELGTIARGWIEAGFPIPPIVTRCIVLSWVCSTL